MVSRYGYDDMEYDSYEECLEETGNEQACNQSLNDGVTFDWFLLIMLVAVVVYWIKKR